MMRLCIAAAIAAVVNAKEFHMGKPKEGIDECPDSKGECKQAFLTQNGRPFQPLSDPQFSLNYTSVEDFARTDMDPENQFVEEVCLSLAELAFISDSFNNQTTNNNTRDPVNCIIKQSLYDLPTYVMTARVRFFGNCSLVENAINENLVGKPCSKRLPEDRVFGMPISEVFYDVIKYGSGIILSGIFLMILCYPVMDACSKNSSSEQMNERARLRGP